MQKLDFTEIEKVVSTLFNNIDVKIAFNGSGQPIIQHPDIIDQVGCFGQFITNVSIHFVGFRQLTQESNKYWGTVFLDFEAPVIFNPGILILTCWYNDGQWTIELNKK